MVSGNNGTEWRNVVLEDCEVCYQLHLKQLGVKATNVASKWYRWLEFLINTERQVLEKVAFAANVCSIN